MTIEIQPVNKKVRDEMRRQKSSLRFAGPACLVAFRIFMMLALIGGFLFCIHGLWGIALRDPRFRMDGETLALAGAIRECPESVVELERIGKQFGGRSLLDPMLIADMEEAYGGSVWIKKILRMRRRFPNRMEVEFLLRLPAAQVWHSNRYWLIDSEAALLPVPGAREKFATLPEIVGVTAKIIGGRPEAGAVWRDEGVTGALGILRAFWGSPLAEVLPVDKIVVNSGTFRENGGRDLVARRRFEVVAAGGAVVRWGTFNQGDVVGELTSAEKLWHLQELLRRDEALAPGVCFDIRTRLPGFSLVE